MDTKFERALVLFAHPDDAEFMCGGTVAAWADAGCAVHYVVCTDGSAGSNEPGMDREVMRPIRAAEQQAAADVLGVASLTLLGEVDGFLQVTPETRRKVTREVRRIRPDVILAPDPSRLWFRDQYINHWDHKQAGLLALTAVMPDAPTRVMFQELEQEGLEPFEVPNLWLSGLEGETYVDITATMDRKLEALACHVSQGTDSGSEWVRERARDAGEQSGLGYEYAEVFREFRLGEDEDEEPS